jgi:hypothetical protein
VYAELPRDTLRALFFVSMATGLGSNPVGLDRGAGGVEQVAASIAMATGCSWCSRTPISAARSAARMA